MRKKTPKLLLSLCVSASVLSACNGGSNQVGGGQSTTGTEINATNHPSLFSTSTCLTGVISTSGNEWYASSKLDITNNCANTIDLTTQTVSLTSQDNSGKGIAFGTLNNWWINNTAYQLTFSAGNGNQQIGTFTATSGTPSIAAKQTISYTGGMNLFGTPYNNTIATTSLSINGSGPTPPATASLNVIVDTSNAGCTGTSNCNGLTVSVNDNTGKPVTSFQVPTTSLGGQYTQPITGLTDGASYTVAGGNITNTTITYTPAASIKASATQTSSVTVQYKQNTPVVTTGNATISLATVVPNYKGNLQVQILNSKNNNSVVNTYSVAQGQSFTTGDLPVTDSTHAYVVSMTTGIADPVQGLYYIESGLPALNITTGKTTTLAIPMKAATNQKKSVSLTINGLQGSDTANINFSDATNKYNYVSYTGKTNGSTTYSIESGLNLGIAVQAIGTGSYQTNPLNFTGAINSNQTIIESFVKTTPPPPSGSTVAGWPTYLAMGAVGGPNITTPTATSTGGNDDFGGRPVDVVFKYAGVNGDGDPGVIDPPTNALSMTNDLTALSTINNRAMRVAIVEYTSQMSGGENFSDFTNAPAGASTSQVDASYIMARHFASLGADAIALATKPVTYNGQNYYGTLIMNPDLLGAIQQNNYIADVNNALPANAVNKAVDQALCFLTTSRTYVNQSNPNGLTNPSYLNKSYTGTPVQILINMLADGYPVWSINGANDAYWNSGMGNPNSTTGNWFNACISNPTYDTNKFVRPNFPNGFEGWVQANNWLIRTLANNSASQNQVTFGWQENMWAVGSGFWLNNELTDTQIASTYSTPTADWLQKNAPSSITVGALGNAYKPDYFLFDRYEMDDSAAPGSATLYSARSWDNYITAIGQVSNRFNGIPIMLWQIPGSHIPYIGELNPEYYNNTAGKYVFSTAPVYFFGDSNLKADLSNMIMGTASGTDANSSVGNFIMQCGNTMYNCPAGYNYQQYLLYYKGKANNYNWGANNNKLALAASNHVFAILWGGGNTTNVIKNFSNPDDHGWLANKIKTYYQAPQSLK